MNEINVKCPLGDSLYWHGCYDSSIKFDKYITGESFAHPAKMSRLLCDRIFRHLKKLGLLKKDSTVVDFMSGIGTTNMIASLHGYKTIGVELESHFIKMQKGNKELLEDKIGRKVDWDILQGDSRKLSEILKSKEGVGIVSPPFLDVVPLQDKNFMIKSSEQRSRNLKEGKSKGHYAIPEAMKRAAEKIMPIYSSNPSNIGNLKDKPLVGVVSPPYSEAHKAEGNPGGIVSKNRQDLQKYLWTKGNQGQTKGQISNLPDKPLVGVVSPPYSKAQEGGGIAKNGYRGKHINEMGRNQPDKVGDRCGYSKHMQGDSEGQIGNLKDAPLVGITSPPYEAQSGGTNVTAKNGVLADKEILDRHRSMNIATEGYGKTDGQIGSEQSDSYLSAMLQVYMEAFRAGISPLVTVTKNPTRKGELRRLDLDTAYLLELAGYRIFDYHRAVLFEERTQMTLDGDIKKIPKGRLSFFKRLSYSKGSPVARWEDILIAIRTEMGGG